MRDLATIDDRMNTAPPRGYLLRKRAERVQAGDLVMSGNRPGVWSAPLEEQQILPNWTANALADLAEAEVRVAKPIGGAA